MLRLTLRRLLVNDHIFVTPVRVLNRAGEYLGSFETSEAMKMAEERNTDLVLVSASPPTAVLDNKDSIQSETTQLMEAFAFDPCARVKKIVFGLNIDIADFERKVEEMRGFLKLGWRCEVSLRGMIVTPAAPRSLVSRILAEIRDVAKPSDTLPDQMRQGFRMQIWPCAQEQAAKYRPPTSIPGSESTDSSVDQIKRYREWKRAKDPRFAYQKIKKELF